MRLVLQILSPESLDRPMLRAALTSFEQVLERNRAAAA